MSYHYMISAEEFAERYQNQELKDTVIVDVREPWEWEQIHLEDSRLIPLQTLPDRLGELDPDRRIYLLCAHGVRSFHAMQYLLQQGFGDVVNVEGGMAEVRLFIKSGDSD